MPYAQAVSCLTLRLHQLAVSSCQVDAHAGRPCTGILHPSAALFECKYCKGRVNSALLVGYKNKHVQCKVTSHREGVCSAEEWKVTSPVPDHCAPLHASWRPSGFIGFLWAPPILHPPPSRRLTCSVHSKVAPIWVHFYEMFLISALVIFHPWLESSSQQFSLLIVFCQKV